MVNLNVRTKAQVRGKEIINIVSDYFNMNDSEIVIRVSKHQPPTRYQDITMALLKKYLLISNSDVAKFFIGYNYQVVKRSLERVNKFCDEDKIYNQQFTELKKIIEWDLNLKDETLDQQLDTETEMYLTLIK